MTITLIFLLCLDAALALTSTLSIAICRSGNLPYVSMVNGTAVGFDIGKEKLWGYQRKLYFFDFSTCADLWKQTYTSMINTIHAAELVPNAMVTNKIVNLIGGSPPPLLLLSIEQIQEKLTDQTLDIGMCGFVIDYDNIDDFDYVNPFYLSSGIQAVVAKPTVVPTFFNVLNAIAGSVESKAQLIILLILFFVFIFGHLVIAAESLIPGQNYRTGYFESTQDGMWFGLIVMSTVGFGEVFPKTLLGRFTTVLWMFVSISLMGMLLAVITNHFLRLQLVPDDPSYSIGGLSDLYSFTVVTASSYAYSVVMSNSPGTNVTLLPATAQAEVFRSVLNGTYQVLTERHGKTE